MENNKRIIVFTGLSLSFDDASQILDADYRPPVKRGDIFKILKEEEKPDIIGIIDGQFHSAPAVAHKEIMEALNEGITVVGGSSMGALRASELDSLGMIGVGFVYNEYKNGNIKSDDDVAVILDPKTYRPLSEALVNIDYKLKGAISSGIITEEEGEKIHEIAKEIYYPHRNYPNIFKKSDLPEDKMNKLIRYINSHEDIKTQDAKEVLKYIKNIAYK